MKNITIEKIFNYSIGSGCPLPRSAKHTTANAIDTPNAEPYTAMLASAI